MRFKSTFKFLFMLLFALWAGNGFAAIVVDSAVATRSNCANDGTITVYATSPSAILYAIVSGPDIRPKQSGNQFAGLPAGSYQVMLTNFSNDTITISAVVAGNYTFPDFAPAFRDPFCTGDSSGVIVGKALNQGKAPFTWVLTNLATNIDITQASDSFLHLPAGNYKLQQLDSCQSFATRYITLSNPDHTFRITSINNRMIRCDSVLLKIQLFVTNGNYANPYTIKIDTKNGSYQHIITNISYGGWYPEIEEKVGGVTYGDFVNITITDACGNSFYKPNTLTVYNLSYNFMGAFDSCKLKYQANFGIVPLSVTPAYNPTTFHLPVFIKLTNPVTGAFIDSVAIYDTSGYANGIASPAALPGQLYHVEIRDECGNTFARNIQWPVPTTPSFSKKVTSEHCRDSTALFDARWRNFFTSIPIFELISGPKNIGSTKPHFAYTDTLIYPAKIVAGAYYTGNGATEYGVNITNFGVGTYHYRVYDTCGNSITDSFIVAPSNVGSDKYMLSYVKGCPGQNSIAVTYDNLSSVQLHSAFGSQLLIKSPNDTARNLNFGQYIASFSYYVTNNATKINGKGCQTIWDTLYIPPYEQPQIAYATQIKCNGTVNVGLQPDSSKGVPPYKYEIISGPQTATVQPSNFFTLTQPGSYVARISDTCGFARTFTFSVDTLSFRQIIKVGSSCSGDSVMLIAEHSPYAKYSWNRPNGGTFTGDTLRIKPILAADYGTYNISKIVNVNNCTDTIKATYTLTRNGTSYHNDSVCAGHSIVFNGKTYTQAGTYYDTIPAAQCDSIVVFTLTNKVPVFSYHRDTICSGSSTVFNGITYTQAGTYYDTIPTAQCDSIVVFTLSYTPAIFSHELDTICAGQSLIVDTNTFTTSGSYPVKYSTAGGCDSFHIIILYVRPAIKDSTAQTICPGQSITVGSNTYTTTGIYWDTLSTTGGCDSIHILNLLVSAVKKDSVFRSICSGQSVTAGSHTYSSTGIYRDTIATTGGCDSIHILNLLVSAVIVDSVTQSLCSGQSITVGSHTYSATGIYRDTLASSGGCDSVHILNLSITPLIKDSVVRSICSGQSVTVGANTYITTGIYRDTLGSVGGCDSIYILNLQVSNVKRDSVVQSICFGQSVTVGTNTYTATGIYRDTFATAQCDSVHILNLTVAGTKQVSATQSICPGQSVTVGSNTYTSSGIYTDTLLSTAGCDSIYTLTLQVVSAKRDSVYTAVCAGQSITVGPNIYSATGIYRDTLTSTGGCDSIHILNLFVTDVKRDTLQASVCQGRSIVIEGKTYAQPGFYSDTFATAQCDSIHTIQIIMLPVPQVHISAGKTTVIADDTVQLYATGSQAAAYSWSSVAALDNPSVPNPIATVNVSSWIHLSVTDTNSCTASDSILLSVVECYGNIYVPNVFSPNNDGYNDDFRLYGNCITLNILRIFNRWGEKVWETSDINQPWDGFYKGELQQPGVFVYLLSYFNTTTEKDLAKELKGSLTLVR
jgi:gliding motility-associated-like protein